MQTSKKLLIRLSSAGDVLLTSPLLRMIKEREPGSEIHFVVKNAYADLIRFNPNVRKVYLVQDNAGVHELDRLRKELLREKFEVTLDLHNNFRSIYLRRGTAPDIRVIEKDIFKRAVLVKTRINLFKTIRSTALKYAQTFDESTVTVPTPELFLPDAAVAKAESTLKSPESERLPVVMICPGARHYTKRWPVEYWKELVRRLVSSTKIVLLGGNDDAAICREIAEDREVMNCAGQLSLIESSAMLKYASVVVTNDSYLMHAANALGRNLVAIFGSSVKEFGFYPYGVGNTVVEVEGLSCRPCSHIGLEQCPKGHFKCMLQSRPESVETAVLSFLGQAGKRN